MHRSLFRLLVSGVFFFCLQAHRGQEQKDNNLRRFGEEFGMNMGHTASMVQDHRGVYWFAGLNGLEMFDGTEAKRFTLPFFRNKILSSNILSTLYLLNDSILMVTNLQGVCRFNIYTHQFTPVPVEKDFVSQSLNFGNIHRDLQGTLYFSTREIGLLQLDTVQDKLVKVRNPKLAELQRVRKMINLNKQYMLVCHLRGYAVVRTEPGNAEVSVPDPFNQFNDSTFVGTISDTYINDQWIYTCIRKKGTAEYINWRYNRKTGRKEKTGIVSNFGNWYFNDSHGNLWIYHDGVYKVDANTGAILTVAENGDAPFSLCYKVYEDRQHNIWFCTNGGVFVLEPGQVSLHKYGEPGKDGLLTHIYVNAAFTENEIWMATYGEGIVVAERSGQFKRRIDLGTLAHDPSFNQLAKVHLSSDSSCIWVAGILGRIACFRRQTGRFDFYSDTILHKQRISDITDDPMGNPVFATNAGRIVQFDNFSRKFSLLYDETKDPSIGIDYISDIYFKGNKDLYVATSFNGLYRIHIPTTSIKAYRLDPEKPGTPRSNDIYTMYPFDNKLLLGTTNGLVIFDPTSENFSAFGPDEGLPFSEIYCLSNFNAGEVLASSSGGLFSLNPSRQLYKDIGHNTGIDKIGFGEIFYDERNGNILLLSDNSYYIAQYSNRPNQALPRTWLFSLKTSDSLYVFRSDSISSVTLRRNQGSFTIRFGSPGYHSRQRLIYRYRIDELEQEWVSAGDQREITYNKLKGGNYTFRLQVQDAEAGTMVQELILNVVIPKVFYETWWFYFLICVLVVILIYTIYRIRINKLLAVEKVRLKLARDLHDDMGSTLSTINILSTVALQKSESDPTALTKYLERISANSQGMMENMGDIVWSINPANDSMEKVMSRMREFANTILEPRNIKFDFDAAELPPNLGLKMEYRRDFFLIYKEAINNAAKYAGCTEVRVKLALRDKTLSMVIHDNGKGFDAETISQGNGLLNMQKRARAIHGELHIQSAAGKGTEISLSVPPKATE